MKVAISNEIIIYDPTPEIENWAKKNLIYQNPDYYNKKRMGFYVGNTPKTLQMFKRCGNSIILPFGVLKRIWKLIKKAPLNVQFIVNKIYPRSQMSLYDYQEEAVQAMLKAKNGILISKARKSEKQFVCLKSYVD